MKRLLGLSVAILVVLLLPTVTHAVNAQDLNKILENIQQSVPGVIQLLFGASYVMGVFLILRSVMKLKVYAQAVSQMSSEKSIVKPIIIMAIGVGFIWLPSLMDSFLYTVWNYGTDSVLAYPENEDIWVRLTNPLIDIMRVFGLIAIIRGWGMLVKAGTEGGQQGGGTGKAIIHIVGGVFAWNIVGIWEVIKNTLGVA